MSDDRAVSVPINYGLMLAIVVILSSGLFVAASDFVEDQQERAVRSGLEVVGNRIGNDLAAADRLAAETGADGELAVAVDVPATVAGSTYTVSVEDTAGGALLTLRSAQPSITVTIPVRTAHPVSETKVSGGRLRVEFATATGTLEVVHG